MKSRGVQRAVKAQRYDRSTGDAPVLGRVTRMPRRSSEGVHRKRRVGERSSKAMDPRKRAFRKLVVVVWSWSLVFVSVCALAVMLFLWIHSSRQSAAAAAAAAADHSAIADRVVSRFDSPTEDQALSLVKRALTLRDEDEIGGVFRLHGHKAEQVAGFLADLRASGTAGGKLTWLGSIDANGLLLDGVVLGDAADELKDQRLALLTPDDDGRWQIDFGAFARVVEPAWAELLEGSEDRAVVRVMAAQDSYFNGPFREEDGWECYGIGSPDIEVILSGYCRKGSPQAAALRRITEDPNKTTRTNDRARPTARRVTLEIRRHPDGQRRQFEILRVLAEDWVLADSDFEDTFR